MNHTSSPALLLITTLAEYQTEFWSAIGREIRKLGHEVAFLSFDDRSTDRLRSEGFATYASPRTARIDTSDPEFDRTMQQFGISAVNHWSSHERITFAIRNSHELRRKLLAHLALADRACQDLLEGGRNPVMVQELGGFLSVVASFFAARRHGLDNWFIEPSFFRGRLFFSRNTFAAPVIVGPIPERASPEVTEYLKRTAANSAIVVPRKDEHQYNTAFRKIVNRRNIKRLVQKIIDKHVYGKRQEFGYIRQHVGVHARMLSNTLKLRNHYTPLRALNRFVYYPLHVPADVALTLRSPQYLDQLALVDFLARSVPHTHRIAIKEHPAMVGAIAAGRLIDLIGRHDNLALLPPSMNNYEVLRAADAVVSVNSKSGAEALLLGKAVVVLGDAFYKDCPLVERVGALADLPTVLAQVLHGPSREVEQGQIAAYFESVWRESQPGELYVAQIRNVEVFTRSLLTVVKESTDSTQL